MIVVQNELFYEKTSPFDGGAKIQSIKGNVLAFNQLLQNGNFASTANWSATRGSISASSNILTYTVTEIGTQEVQNRIQQTISIPVGHKVFFRASIKPKYNNRLTAYFNGSSGDGIIFTDITANAWNDLEGTYTIAGGTATTLYIMLNCATSYAISDTIQVKNVMLVDLTLMFGAGNEPMLDEFKALFPLDYYSYNAGTLLALNATGIRTKNDEKDTTTALPIADYFPSGMKSAGTVYDELTPTKAIQRVEVVDLGSLEWTYNTSAQCFYSADDIGAYQGPGLSCTCARYTSVANVTDIALLTGDKKICFRGLNDAVRRLYLKDLDYSTASSLKAALSGVYLFYELATPTETDVDLDLSYPVYRNGTEQVLPVNTSTPTTAPLLADINYIAETESVVPYRTFWLKNANDEEWDLTNKEFKCFLNSPTGLGFKKTVNVTRYGERAVKDSEVYEFPTPQGELLFYDSANQTRYDRYNEFMKFLNKQPITLYYQLPVSALSGIPDTYSLDCEVTEVQKSESSTESVLRSSVVFDGLSFWKGEEVEISGTGDTYTIENDSDFPIGFEITVEGTLEKPYFTLEQDSEIYGESKFVDDTATPFDSFYVNSKDGEQDLILEQSGAVLPNPLSYQDLSISNGSIYVTFVKLAKGESTLTIGMDSGSITSVDIRFNPMYRSV